MAPLRTAGRNIRGRFAIALACGALLTNFARLEAVDETATIKMTVSNDGDPISEANREKIFDSFFTTPRDIGGTGMGLAIVEAVMTNHGGTIRLLPSDKSVAFEIQFPAA